MTTKRKVPAKRDILESSSVKRAEEIVSQDENIPPIIKDSLIVLKSEIEKIRVVNKAHENRTSSGSKKLADKGHHPAVTGLSIGGAKEVLDYIFGGGFAGDVATLGVLALPAIYGGITAMIATAAAFLAKGRQMRIDSSGYIDIGKK